MKKIYPFIKLCLICLGLFIFFAYIGPFVFSKVPIWQDFAAVQVKNNIHSGALYYTDVPITKEAEVAVREGVRKGMLIRKQEREREANQ